jgi:hypothetical protein
MTHDDDVTVGVASTFSFISKYLFARRFDPLVELSEALPALWGEVRVVTPLTPKLLGHLR